MKPVLKVKITVDFLMTIAFPVLMAYSLIGEAAHEWVGIAIFALFVLHHVLNRKSIARVFKGKYFPLRVLQTIVAGLIFVFMLGSMASAVIVSRHVFSFVSKADGSVFAERVHLLCAFWSFVLTGFHLGLHWNMMSAIAKKRLGQSKVFSFLLKVIGCLFALYGALAFYQRKIADYLFLKGHFVFYDFSESKAGFLFDYFSITALFVLLGCLAARLCQRKKKTSQRTV